MPTKDENILVELNQFLKYLVDGKVEPATDLLYKLDSGFSENKYWSEILANCRKYLLQYEEGAVFLNALANGNLNVAPPDDPLRNNYMISQYKQLHSSLRHLTWQTQQIANGDLNQKISFLGELSVSFNKLIESLREMKQLEERLRLATNAARIGIWDWDIVNNILLWDDSMYYLYDIRKGDFAGAYDAWIKNVHPDDLEFTESEIQAAIRGEREYAPEFRIIHTDGSVRTLKAESKTIYDENGKALRMTGTNIDITEIRQKEERLIKSEQNLAEAERIGNSGSWNYTVSSEIFTWSENLFKIFDVDPTMPDELVFRHFTENIVHPDDRAGVSSMFQAAIEGKRSFDTEFRIFKFDGSIRIIHMFAETQCEEHGEVSRLIGKAEDITERKLADEVIKESEEKFKTLFETAGDAIMLFAEGRWVDCNTPALKIFGCAREQIIGADPSSFSPPNQPDGRSSEELTKERVNLAFDGKPQFFEWEHCRKDGTPFAAEVKLNRLDLGGKPYIQAIVRDITERKQAENKVSEQLDELQRWYEATADREERIIEIKKEVNDLLLELGKPPRYGNI